MGAVYAALPLSLVWTAVWVCILLNDPVYQLISRPVWLGMLVLAVAGVALFGRALDLVVPGRQECLVLLIFWAVIPYVLRLLTKTVEALHTLWRRHRRA